MRIFVVIIFVFSCQLDVILSAPVDNEETENVDFPLVFDRSLFKRSPDYGAGLGGPVAAGIRVTKQEPDKNETSNGKNPDDKSGYVQTNNLNNTKKCDVVRFRKTLPMSKAVAGKVGSSKAFDDYVKKYKKTYPSEEAKERARHNFMASLDGANNLNSGRCSTADAQFGVTQYSDWTYQDFKVKLGGTREDPKEVTVPKYKIDADQAQFLFKIPSLDWRKFGVFPSVRDQLQCGGCYAFSSSDLLAAQERVDRKIYHQTVEPYSAQYLIDCMPEPYGYGCRGGRPAAVLNYMTECEECVILKERCYEYHNRNNLCKQKPSQNCKQFVGAKPVFSRQVNIDTDRELETMAALLRWGPVVTVVDLSPAWQYYNGSGILRHNHCTRKPDHAVVVVGYDYTGVVPFYWIRNSWSSDWGFDGYIRLEAGKNTCGVANAVLVTCTLEDKCASFKDIHDFVEHPNIQPNLKGDGTAIKH